MTGREPDVAEATARAAEGAVETSSGPESTDLDADYARLRARGVAFVRPPTAAGPVKLAVFSDTVGNLIQLHQPVVGLREGS